MKEVDYSNILVPTVTRKSVQPKQMRISNCVHNFASTDYYKNKGYYENDSSYFSITSNVKINSIDPNTAAIS
jgi:hypothetical protein